MFRKVRPAFASLQANAGGWGGITLPLVIQKCAPLMDVSSTPYRLWRQVDYPNSALAISVRRINRARPRFEKIVPASWRMGRDSNPRCLSAHTLSRRAQSTTLSPIQNNLPFPLNLNLSAPGDNRNRVRLRGSALGRVSQLQAPEQFVERQM